MAKPQRKRSRRNIKSTLITQPRRITAEGAKIIASIEAIQQKAFDDQKRLGSTHPTWEPQHDARFTAFSRLLNGLNSAKLSVIFVETCLLDDTWWRVNFPAITLHDKENNARNYALSTKHSFGMFVFILIENMLRLILRALDPMACSGGTEAFESIYACLLRSKLSRAPTDAFELLELVRLVRNTIHNDGVYRHRKGQDGSVNYKGITYFFNHGKPVDFVTWDFLLLLADDIRDLLVQIILDDTVARLSEPMVDQSAA